MNNKIIRACLLLLLASVAHHSHGQSSGPLMIFVEGDIEDQRAGYIDADSTIVFPAIFDPAFAADIIDHIAAVVEYESRDIYHITRSGEKVARDSAFFFDNNTICESEGYIRFKDYKSGKIGLLDSNGQVVLPAIYDILTDVRGGLLAALQGAIIDRGPDGQDEHPIYKGGEVNLIDVDGNVLVRNFPMYQALDLYSMQMSRDSTDDPDRAVLRGANGQYYSFIDFDREFRNWLNDKYLPGIDEKKLNQYAFDEMVTADYGPRPKDSVLLENSDRLIRILRKIASSDEEFSVVGSSISYEALNRMKYPEYYNNCREYLEKKYPIRAIYIRREIGQDYLEFVRTPDGYRLLEFVLSTK